MKCLRQSPSLQWMSSLGYAEGLTIINESTRGLTKTATGMCWRSLDTPTKLRGCYNNIDINTICTGLIFAIFLFFSSKFANRWSVKQSSGALEIRNLNLSDFGFYQCLAKNELSEDNRRTFLVVTGNLYSVRGLAPCHEKRVRGWVR